MATIIKAKKDEPATSLIKRFKKTVAADQILKIAKEREFYRKPSEIKKEKKKEVLRLRRRERRMAY
ncbi:30S ribosomal protein S21 [Microgenomates group bacterium RIFCSPLOWO2_01_FULL_47_10]|nr:MAG: 30S ribosomal protein S21 [Microgenomates group bacterium RIFCSPLOWO2_01_FULL_47_10]